MILLSFGNVLFWIYALIVFLVVLGVIIGLHELGHLFFAKRAGILCHEYAIGMGPIIKQWKKPGKETAVSLRSIPFGGFVSMAGEDTNEVLLKEGQEISLKLENDLVKEIIVSDKMDGDVKGSVISYDLYSKNGEQLYIELDVDGTPTKYNVDREALYVFSPKQKIQIAPYDRCFESKKWWPRFITILGGPLMNFVIAIVIYLFIGLIAGVPSTETNVVGSVNELYPIAEFVSAGDQITNIDGIAINDWNDLTKALDNKYNETVTITYTHDGVSYTKEIKTVIADYRLGVSNFIIAEENGKTVGKLLESDKGLQVSLIYDENHVASLVLNNNDIILGYYNGNEYIETKEWKTLITYINSNPEAKLIKLKVERAGTNKVEDVESKMWNVDSLEVVGASGRKNMLIGVSSGTRFSFFGGLGNGFKNFGNSITLVFKTLGALFASDQIHITDLSGPVGIFTAVKAYLATDFITFMSFVAMISANIGVVNLLPIPALDGGRLVFLAYEGITRKKVSKKFETTFENIVFILLMMLFVFITINDIIRCF